MKFVHNQKIISICTTGSKADITADIETHAKETTKTDEKRLSGKVGKHRWNSCCITYLAYWK